jgi:hypothetical protein
VSLCLSSGQDVVNGDLVNDRPVQDDRDLTRSIDVARRVAVGLRIRVDFELAVTVTSPATTVARKWTNSWSKHGAISQPETDLAITLTHARKSHDPTRPEIRQGYLGPGYLPG